MSVASKLFSSEGVDTTTIAQIAHHAGCSETRIYGLFGSKAGIVRALIEDRDFGSEYEAKVEDVLQIEDPVRLLVASAAIASMINSMEVAFAVQLSEYRGADGSLDPLAEIRLERQKPLIEQLSAGSALRRGLSKAEALDRLWILSSSENYRSLVKLRGWTPKRYEAWLAECLITQLLEPALHPAPVE